MSYKFICSNNIHVNVSFKDLLFNEYKVPKTKLLYECSNIMLAVLSIENNLQHKGGF